MHITPEEPKECPHGRGLRKMGFLRGCGALLLQSLRLRQEGFHSLIRESDLLHRCTVHRDFAGECKKILQGRIRRQIRQRIRKEFVIGGQIMKNILIITADNCDNSEVLYTYYRMLEEGYSVDIACFEKIRK